MKVWCRLVYTFALLTPNHMVASACKMKDSMFLRTMFLDHRTAPQMEMSTKPEQPAESTTTSDLDGDYSLATRHLLIPFSHCTLTLTCTTVELSQVIRRDHLPDHSSVSETALLPHSPLPKPDAKQCHDASLPQPLPLFPIHTNLAPCSQSSTIPAPTRVAACTRKEAALSHPQPARPGNIDIAVMRSGFCYIQSSKETACFGTLECIRVAC